MTDTIPSQLVSLHGGHSGQFCCHAKDSLEQMIQAYIKKGFTAVGISEHMPPPGDAFLYPDEIARGLTASDLGERFARYFGELDRLKNAYQGQIHIYKGFETETITGWQRQAAALINTYQPDYVVGSVHHVEDVCFDYSKAAWDGLASQLGSPEALYLAYLDAQFDMIQTLHPFVVGHFDIIRIFDPDYETRFRTPDIWKKVVRNLTLIRDLNLTMDFNLRPLTRGEAHAYPCPDILKKAGQMGISFIPGDDAHSREQAGLNVDWAVNHLREQGFSTVWPQPWCRPFDGEETP